MWFWSLNISNYFAWLVVANLQSAVCTIWFSILLVRYQTCGIQNVIRDSSMSLHGLQRWINWENWKDIIINPFNGQKEYWNKMHPHVLGDFVADYQGEFVSQREKHCLNSPQESGCVSLRVSHACLWMEYITGRSCIKPSDELMQLNLKDCWWERRTLLPFMPFSIIIIIKQLERKCNLRKSSSIFPNASWLTHITITIPKTAASVSHWCLSGVNLDSRDIPVCVSSYTWWWLCKAM